MHKKLKINEAKSGMAEIFIYYLEIVFFVPCSFTICLQSYGIIAYKQIFLCIKLEF